MIDETVAAEAVAEPVSAPETNAPEPKAERASEPTSRGAIDRAFAALDAQEKAQPVKEAVKAEKPQEAKPDAEPVKSEGQDRDEQGRFKAKDGTEGGAEAKPEAKAEEAAKPEVATVDAPNRFSADAKAAWKDTPAPVQAEIRRAMGELESGLQQYQQRYQSLRPFDELAQRYGTTVEQALNQYITLEQTLRQDPFSGLQRVFDYIGMSPNEYASIIMGRTPDDNARQQDMTIRELRQHIAGMEQKLQGVTASIQSNESAQIERELQQFAANHPRFEELRAVMGGLINANMASDLQQAYEMADRLNPAPASVAVAKPAEPATPEPAPKPDLTAQTRKSGLSVTGAPSSGSNPATRKPPSSARAALDSAFAQVGL